MEETTPFHARRDSPFAIPFSWEHLPGVPKSPIPPTTRSFPRLPLPPPLKPTQAPLPRTKPDPFAAALAECAKASPGPGAADLCRRKAVVTAAAAAISARFRLVGLYGSCKSSCYVSDSTTIRIPRDRTRPALTRRSKFSA
ncbi:hypothetical protein J5N97_012397 [Dioscorea zingiberensis]|uniref:Uncharacterized protein n=1 Tax=Dioscorea zingiberensis TaxID=325984 RepID=A0A9D5HHS8_9LILI|nr:hypothetical protein J5N97_012397 [Dioscorea zingiberensis]